MKKKKKWNRPKLQVLLRGNPEEQVLVACKTVFSGPGTSWDYCTNGPGPFSCTGSCFSPRGS
jgi:hypothetical protein